MAHAHLGYDGPLAPETELVGTLRLDSLRFLTLVAELENHFEVTLEDADAYAVTTAADLVAVLRRRMRG